VEKNRYFTLLENERIIYLFGNQSGKIHTSKYHINDNDDSEFLTLTNYRLVYESFDKEKESTQIINTNDISSIELSIPKKSFEDLIYGIIFGTASLVWVWFSFAFGFTSIITWLILLAIAGFSGVNLFTYFATKEIPTLAIKKGPNDIIIDLLSIRSLADSGEIIKLISSQSIGIGIPIPTDNQ